MARKSGTSDIRGLGIVLTGYMEKKNPVTGSYAKRFLVLTHESFHWFKRDDGYDLFGEERGHVGIGTITSIKLVDGSQGADKRVFEILSSTDRKRRYFRPLPDQEADKALEWVNAINSVVECFKLHPKRRTTLSNFHALDALDSRATTAANSDLIVPRVISLKSAFDGSEMVIARNPAWERVIVVPFVHPGDALIISTSNGGVATVPAELMADKYAEGGAFEVAIQGISLQTAVRMSVLSNVPDGDITNANSTNIYTTAAAASTPRSAKTQASSGGSASKRAPLEVDKSVASVCLSLLEDQHSVITLLLAGAAVGVGLVCHDALRRETMLLFIACLALAGYASCVVINKARVEVQAGRSKTGMVFHVILHAHSFAPRADDDLPCGGAGAEEADADAEEEWGPIPQRFIDGCGGDMAEARRRWDITAAWRKAERVDAILQEKQPFFSLIKENYPHYHAGRGRLGHVCFWERPGDLNLEPMSKAGATTEDLVRHWMFVTEYQWQVLLKGDETAKSIAVIDVKGTGIGDFFGTRLDYIKKCVAHANHHYPERSYVVYIVNANFVFTTVWAIVKPWVHPNTQKKVRIVGSGEAVVLAALKEHIDAANIPRYYGGDLACGDGGKDSARFASPDVLVLNDYVQRLNAGTLPPTALAPPDASTDASAEPRLSAKTPTRGGAVKGSSTEVVSPLTPLTHTGLSDWSINTPSTQGPR